ncbi:MAG TPA: hypothetical protein VMV65_02075 [Alphaproteobacteria bacterium]|nr:hypothetical protein [Alphaproteobacteria bacterium]
MITETDDQQQRDDDRTILVWSLLVSGFANLMVWIVLGWAIIMHIRTLVPTQERPEVITVVMQTMRAPMVASSSHHIAAHSHPIPQTAQQPQHQEQPQPPHKSVAMTLAATPRPQEQPTELSRQTPTGTPVPRSAPKRAEALAEQLAQQQAAFQKEADQLNAKNGPISIATIDPNARESATKSFRMNLSGSMELQGQGYGFLVPLKAWIVNGLHCYMGQYHWLYPTGGTEVGDIPWPFCYRPGDDPIARGEREFPFPLPPAGYQLPAGTYLYPIEKDVYESWIAHQ